MTGPRLGARLWWGLGVLVAGLWAGGLLSLPEIAGLPTVPAYTLWLLPVVHFARDLAAAIAAGAAAVALMAPSPVVERWLRGWCVTWVALLVPFILLTVSDAEALGGSDAISAAGTFLTGTLIGQVVIAQGVLVLLAVASLWGQGLWRWVTVTLLVVAAAAPALVGHGGLSSAHVSATVSLALHLASASLWMGGLAVAVAAVAAGAGVLVVTRFSTLALWCVIVVGESGLLSASLRLAEPTAFTGTVYGSLVLAKAVALGFLIRWGWLQRTRVVARFSADQGSARLLAVFAGWELTLMGGAVAAGILLARMGPPAAGVPATGFTVLSLAALALALPLLISTALPGARNPIAFASGYPEAVAVGFLIVVTVVGVVGVLGAVLGSQWGVIVGALVVCAAGWLWLSGTRGTRSVFDLVIVMVAWPALAWFLPRPAGSGWQLVLVAVIAAEALLAYVMRSRLNAPALQPVAVAG